MAEENVNPQKEAFKIVDKYLSELGWAREYKNNVMREIGRAYEKDQKFRQGDQKEEIADGAFASEIDDLIQKKTKQSKEILEIIYKKLKNRNDLGFYGKRMMKRIKDHLTD